MWKLLLSPLSILPPLVSAPGPGEDESLPLLAPADVFELEYASDPELSPDGERIVYIRHFMDVMQDRLRGNLWLLDVSGDDHRPLTTGLRNDSSPRWSPDGGRLAYVSSSDGTPQLYVRWMDTGATARLTQLTHPPTGISWSPDGRWIAFVSFVRNEPEAFVGMPEKPEGAEWADPPRVIRSLVYRADGAGYLEEGHRQVFVVPSVGGTSRQLTSGPFHHEGPPSWTPGSRSLLVSANRDEDGLLDPLDSELHEVALDGGAIRTLTERQGPDESPVVSPDGSLVAYTGFDDRRQGHQTTRLYLRELSAQAEEGAPAGRSRVLCTDLDRSVRSPRWAPDGSGVYFLYDDRGATWIGRADLEGGFRVVAGDVGGTTLGRPYASGSYSVGPGGRVAFTRCSATRPADVAVAAAGEEPRQLTDLNGDLLGARSLAEVEELVFSSSHDGRSVQGWLLRPPGSDPDGRHPLLLEIHGGPFANYGARFSAECQLYAAAGYVVLYVNPRGSTSYGEEFGNLIHHAYPGNDYDDLISGVDAVLARGLVDPQRLFVTGGSGGGVLTSWIVGKTDRFQAAVVAKPVINWMSFALTADIYNFFYQYWFPGFPWEHPEHYFSRSPLSLVGNVTTPTMLLTGEQDFRTPISETEQYYQALQLRGVETALVRVPGASHGIASRPSLLIAKVLHVLRWFELHDPGASQASD